MGMSERWKVSSPDSVEIKIDRNNDVVDGRVFGRASSAATTSDGSTRIAETTAAPEGRASYHFMFKF